MDVMDTLGYDANQALDETDPMFDISPSNVGETGAGTESMLDEPTSDAPMTGVDKSSVSVVGSGIGPVPDVPDEPTCDAAMTGPGKSSVTGPVPDISPSNVGETVAVMESMPEEPTCDAPMSGVGQGPNKSSVPVVGSGIGPVPDQSPCDVPDTSPCDAGATPHAETMPEESVDKSWVTNPYSEMVPMVDKLTGKIVYRLPDLLDNQSTCAEPPSPKPAEIPNKQKKRSKPEHGFACPPSIDPAVACAAKASLPATQEFNLEHQRDLKRRVEQEAKLKLEEKKQKTMEKQQEASQVAVEKAKAKLQKALAKAEALAKKDPVRRRLDPSFQNVAGASAGVPEPPASPPAKAPSTRAKNADALVKLSPKASQFAKASVPSPGHVRKQRSDSRMRIAMDQFAHLRVLALPDLELPSGETFDKKILACIMFSPVCMHICLCVCCSLACQYTVDFLTYQYRLSNTPAPATEELHCEVHE